MSKTCHETVQPSITSTFSSTTRITTTKLRRQSTAFGALLSFIAPPRPLEPREQSAYAKEIYTTVKIPYIAAGEPE